MFSVMLCFGTRPEAIKMCPLVKELHKRGTFRVITAVSGQHRELLRDVLHAFDIRPQYDLFLMREGQGQPYLAASVLTGMSDVLAAEHPRLVLVHGDTTTAFATALCCFYHGIPVGHVEAGLRTYDIHAPFPEEFNRRAVGLLARYHFAPTQTAADNLLREGASAESVFVTGNTGIDALRFTVRPDYRSPHLTWAEGGTLVVVTLHRRESLGAPMEQMIAAIRRVAYERKNLRFLWALHPNPRVREAVERALGNCPTVRLCPPMEVTDFHNILARARMILTDSGGIQEEASALGIPTLVLRDRTERPEGVRSGVLRLAGTSYESVYRHVSEACDRLSDAPSPHWENVYGDGRASARIADILERKVGDL